MIVKLRETPPELKKIADETTLNLWSPQSKRLYVTAYKKFKNWTAAKKATITENVGTDRVFHRTFR